MDKKDRGALSRLHRTARKVVRSAAIWMPLMAAILGGAMPAKAASAAHLNINVVIQGITNITDLTAIPGTSTGTISLSWTEPFHSAGVAPFEYDVRVSSVGQIFNDTSFSTSSVLSVFSPSIAPVPGAGGGSVGFVVTGLTNNVTYYFAIREKDSTTFHGSWSRTLSPPVNVNNFAYPLSGAPGAPAAGALLSVIQSSLTANWSTSLGATSYVLVASTNSTLPPSPISASTTSIISTVERTHAGYTIYASDARKIQ
jgi:hypothetical protein